MPVLEQGKHAGGSAATRTSWAKPSGREGDALKRQTPPLVGSEERGREPGCFREAMRMTTKLCSVLFSGEPPFGMPHVNPTIETWGAGDYTTPYTISSVRAIAAADTSSPQCIICRNVVEGLSNAWCQRSPVFPSCEHFRSRVLS